jgi:hypothetical protein
VAVEQCQGDREAVDQRAPVGDQGRQTPAGAVLAHLILFGDGGNLAQLEGEFEQVQQDGRAPDEG